MDAELAAQPIAQAPRGGTESGFSGTHSTPGEAQPSQAQGQGPFLEADEATVFKAIHNLVLRQERLAKNRLAIDTYWTHVKRGHGLFFRLEKLQDRDQYKCAIAPGTNTLTLSAVPNKLADLCSKVVETLMVDPPAPSPRAENDSEEAERAAEMAEEFLVQDGGEKGTRDARLFWQALDAATSKSANYLHYWVDRTGNGSVPLQIKAHPQAQDANNPLTGPDGSPTTDYILRYVTDQQQFTTDPAQAAAQWLPKIRIDRLNREHVRCYPEYADVNDAEMVIVLDYCTVADAKRRWPDSVGQMDDDDIGRLCDWMPPRYLVLLPPSLRARWKIATGDQTDPKGSSNDERILFFYACYRRSTPDYPKACKVFVSGASEGTMLGRGPLAAEIPLPTGGTDVRVLDIPLVQVTLEDDADDHDPTGKPFCARVGGANEAAQQLGTGFIEAMDKALHPAVYTPVTSPVTGDDVANSRATGDHIPILSEQDKPHYEDAPQLPGDFERIMEWQYEQMNSAMSTSKPAQGADHQQEVSGKAREIAVQQSNIALSRPQQQLMSAYERHWRIKCQLAMAEFTTPQLIRYEGEDGAYKEEWWTGVDFAKVTDISVKAGTGTMKPPEQKVAYVQQMQQMGYMAPDEALEVAKPTFAKSLGVPPDPVQQNVERQVGAWLKGPPSPEWIAQAREYQQAKAVADQENAVQQQQYEAVMQQHQAESQAASTAGVPHEATPPQAPQPVQPSVPAPWTPFQPLPCDDEPLVAQLRQSRLRKLMNTARFRAQPPEWQGVVFEEYARMRSAVAAAQAPPALPHGVTIGVKAGAGDVAQAEQAATHPGQANQQQKPQQPPKRAA